MTAETRGSPHFAGIQPRTPDAIPPPAGVQLSEIGHLLRDAREKRHISILDASSALRIKPVFLEALEEGDYNALPGPAYVTGFLRNYAAYLGFHPDDMVQEFYATRPMPQPSVKAATRVLANGHERHFRRRVMWTIGIVILFLGGGFAIKTYNDTYNRAYSAPLNVTPANLGATGLTSSNTRPKSHAAASAFRLRLRAVAPVWVRVTADGRQVFQGMLRGRGPLWTGRRAIYVATYDGAHLRVIYNGRPMGLMTQGPGLTFFAATPTGWRHVA